LKTNLRGHLTVAGDNGRPVLLGQIEGVEGGHAYYQGNTFDMDDLLVSFKDSERITPELDAHATTYLRDYKIFLHLWGTPDDSHVEPTSQPELSRPDLITLLTFGFTSQDRGASSNLTTAGANAAFDALTSLSGIDQQAQKFIPKGGSVLKDPSFRLTTTYSQRLGSMQPTAQLEGKVLGNLLHDRLKVRVQQQPNVSGGRGTKAQLEYKIDDHWSAQGQYDGDNSDYSFPDLGLDLKFHQEMK
jgi:translocation and assembly module TamB